MGKRTMREYSIPFLGLKEGQTSFEWEIDQDFFEEGDDATIRSGEYFVHLTFDKRPGLFELDFFVDGHFDCECDRCLNPLTLSVNGNHKLYVKFQDEGANDPDVLFIPRDSHTLELRQHIYEYILLSVPMKRVCELGTKGQDCDPKALAYLNQGANTEQIDPRWAKLIEAKSK